MRHTRKPYELILVDNGSTDGTAAYLEEIKNRPDPQRVLVLTNADNRGNPRACNQGWQASKGRFVAFVHNDAVVTEGWLDGLVAWALHEWPGVGMVGPVSNVTRAPQHVPTDYQNLDQMADFARGRQQEYARKAVIADRLTGFCLLTRREVLEKVGGFDERFQLGFADDDLSLKIVTGGLALAGGPERLRASFRRPHRGRAGTQRQCSFARGYAAFPR